MKSPTRGENETEATEPNVSCVEQLENITQWIDHHIGVGHEKVLGKVFENPIKEQKVWEPRIKMDEHTFEEAKEKRAQHAKAQTPGSKRNNVLIECNSNEERPELTLKIIQNLLLSHEQSLEKVDSGIIQDDSKPKAEEKEEEEEEEVVELEPPKKRPVPLVDLEQEDEGDAMLFKCIDEKISELEKAF